MTKKPCQYIAVAVLLIVILAGITGDNCLNTRGQVSAYALQHIRDREKEVFGGLSLIGDSGHLLFNSGEN